MHTTFENLTSNYIGCRAFKAILSKIYSLDSEHCKSAVLRSGQALLLADYSITSPNGCSIVSGHPY